MARKYSTISVETTLASSINSSQTSMVVATGTGTTLMGGVVLTTGDTFAVAIDPETSSEEIVYITAVASDTLTITRGQAGTAQVQHNAGATVQHVFTGNDAQHFEDTVIVALTPDNVATVTNKNLSSGTNSFPSSLVTLTGSQTLTNKDLSSATNTMPTSTVTLTGTQTLTNKTINLTSNTLVATSAQLASAVTDETGSGSLVFSTSPTIVTPVITQGVRTPSFTTNSYTLLDADAGQLLLASNGSTAGTISIPTDATRNFAVGTQITVIQTGTGQITISAATPATTSVFSTGATAAQPRCRAQYSTITIIKTAANTWYAVGDLS